MARICVADVLGIVTALLHREHVGDDVGSVDDPILALRGVGKAIWADEDADAYVERLRSGWQ